MITRRSEAGRYRPPLRRYLERRLGRTPGERWFNFFVRPFGAPSPAHFWRRWNPVYGYFLGYFVYRPAARVVPRRAATMATFIFAGLVLHDLPAWLVLRRVLPPGGTVAFTLFGAGVLVGEQLRVDLSRQPVWVRFAANGAYLAVCTGAMLAVVLSAAKWRSGLTRSDRARASASAQ